MGTPALYQFSCENHLKINVYTNYDGYPHGAALHFYIALMNSSTGNFATQFVRANTDAELCAEKSYSIDYVYKISGEGTKAHVEGYKNNERTAIGYNQSLIYTGYLHEFIDKNTELIKDYKPFKRVEKPYGFSGSEILNEIMAARILQNAVAHLRRIQGKSDIIHWHSALNQVKNLVEAFPDLETEEIKNFCKPLAMFHQNSTE
jgi:hypothetical protein